MLGRAQRDRGVGRPEVLAHALGRLDDERERSGPVSAGQVVRICGDIDAVDVECVLAFDQPGQGLVERPNFDLEDLLCAELGVRIDVVRLGHRERLLASLPGWVVRFVVGAGRSRCGRDR